MKGKEVEECVKSFADILITEGIDRYGDIHTPMFCYQLDLKSHKPPARDINPMCVSFDASFQSRCSNLYYDTNNIRMLYELSDLTGDNTYASAADDYLRYFMDNCVSKLGLFGWGEHIYYNVFFDRFNFRGHDAHELEHWLPLWEEMWKLNPKAVTDEIEAIHEYCIYDPRAYHFDRHAHWLDGSSDGRSFVQHGGLFAYSFAFLHNKTGLKRYLDWAVRIARYHWDRRDPDTGLVPAAVVKAVAGHDEGTPGLMQGHAALWLIKAYQQVSEPLFLEISETYVKALVPMLEEIFSAPSSGPAKYGGNYSRDVLRAGFALMEVHRVRKHDWCLEMAEKIVLHADDHPERGGCDWESLEPENCGNTILLCLDLYSATHDMTWLDRALEKARYVRSNLYSNGLFRFASEGPVSDRYCAYSDATLSYAFVRLAQALAAI